MTLLVSHASAGVAARGGTEACTGVDASVRGVQTFNIAWPGRLTPLLEAAVVVSIWLLSRLYQGIVQDNRIYLGRALADLDPQGLGREPAFLYDHQTTHTIFSHLIRPLVATLGPSATSISVTLAILLIWLAAAAWLAHRLMPRGMVAAALICAAVLPAFYGPFDICWFGQAPTAPRGFAEAIVMAALAALLGGRRLLAGALLLLAAAFHPIMAAPGFGVMFLMLAREDRRWWGLVPLGLIGLIAAGGLQLDPAKTLFTTVDPDWRRAIHRYIGVLFVTNWPAASWSEAALSSTTLSLAVVFLRGRCRTIALAVLIVAAVSLAASVVFGDLLGSVLILELQLWRALWLVQVLAVMLIPVLAVELWTMQRRDARVSMVLMGLSWTGLYGTLGAFPVLAVALGFAASARWRKTDLAPAKTVTVVSTGALVYLLAAMGLSAYTGVVLFRLFSALHFAMPLSTIGALHLQVFPLVAVVLAPLLCPTLVKPRTGRLGLALAAVLLVPFAALTWDQRTPTRRMTDLGQGRAELNRLIGPATASGVLWMPDDNAPWFLLSRATWVSDLQRSVGTFSRPLLMQWETKTTELLASGLGKMGGPKSRNWSPLVQTGDETEARDGALRICALKNGPQAIVLAGDLTQRFQPGVAARWRTPATGVWRPPGITPAKLITFDYYTIVRCNRVSPSVSPGVI